MFAKISKTEYCKKRKRNIVFRFLIKFNDIITRFTIPSGLRIFLYKLNGIKIGKNVFIGMDCMLDSSFPELITIEDNVTISFRVMIICHDDAKGLNKTTSDRLDMTVSRILLKKGCYIGAGAIILPGITVGENSVIGAGSVVNKDIADNSVAVGAPAKVIKTI